MKKIYIFAIAILGLLFISATNVKAVSENKPSTAQINQTSVEGKLTDAKLKACQNKQNAILKRNDQLVKMAQNMLTNFDQIASRVEKYYTDKVVPNGKTVSNYDTLVAEIAAKKTVVQTDLTKATADAKAFDCTGNNPKEQLTQFRTDMQTVKKDLQDYRKAIINLIVAVHSVTGTTESTSNTTKN